MSLTSVKMSEEVWLTCMTHALSTETEEIMGLLLGDIQYSKGGSATASIWGASPQTRSDRRKDRVETNPEQLAAASAMAERMTAATGTTTRVIGWYHSHPHITVLPSHVDVRTQAMYQLLESGFIGLIFSCFNEDAHKVGRIQVIAFQSLDGKQSQAQRPASLSPVKRSTVIDIGPSLSSSDDTSTKLSSGKEERLDQDINDSNSSGTKAGGRSSDLEGIFAHADANYSATESTRNQGPETASTAYVDIEPMDMSDGMQEAMLRSNMDMSGAEYIQKEVPLQLLPASSLLQLKSPSVSFIDLQHVLYQEEKAAYNLAISQNMRDGKGHPLTFIHHTATYQASMCKLMEYCLSPAIDAMQQRARENEIRLAMLAEEAEVLEAEVESNALQLAAGSSHHSDVA